MPFMSEGYYFHCKQAQREFLIKSRQISRANGYFNREVFSCINQLNKHQIPCNAYCERGGKKKLRTTYSSICILFFHPLILYSYALIVECLSHFNTTFTVFFFIVLPKEHFHVHLKCALLNKANSCKIRTQTRLTYKSYGICSIPY